MFYYKVWLTLPQNEIIRINTNHQTAYSSPKSGIRIFGKHLSVAVPCHKKDFNILFYNSMNATVRRHAFMMTIVHKVPIAQQSTK